MAVGAVVGALFSTGGGIWSGLKANEAAKDNAELQEKQAELLYEEAQQDAAKTYEDAVRFSAEQKMAFLSSGVEASGTASDTVLQTMAWGKEESDAILRRGKAQKQLGFEEARLTRKAGKAQMISSFMGAAGPGASALGSARSTSAAGAPSGSSGTGFARSAPPGGSSNGRAVAR